MPGKDLRNALYSSFKNRAMMYYHIFDELRKEIGEKKAAAIMKRAIHKRGVQVGKELLAKYGPDDLEGLKHAFLALDPDEGGCSPPKSLAPMRTGWTSGFTGVP